MSLIPPSGDRRLAWLADLELVVATEARRICDRLTADGWAVPEAHAMAVDFGANLCARLTDSAQRGADEWAECQW